MRCSKSEVRLEIRSGVRSGDRQLSGQVSEDDVLVARQDFAEGDAEDAASDDFSGSDRQHHERDRQCDAVCVLQDERHNQDVRDDRRQAGDDQAAVSQLVREECADQGYQASEDDVRQDGSAHDVSDDAAEEKSRDRGRREYRQDRQHLRHADLHLSKAECLQQDDQHDVNRRDQPSLGDE